MSYPQSGGYGYGQNPQGAQQYGQPADYNQQYASQQQYGQPQYGAQEQYGAQQQYGQQGYDAQQQYQQQYAQQAAQYGYGSPQPASAGLPSNTPTIIAAVIGALGVITLFCGFLNGYSVEDGPVDGAALFQSHFAVPYALVAFAGVLALTTFLVGSSKQLVAAVAAVTVTAAFITIFQFAKTDPMFEGDSIGRGAGAILLLITAILAAIAGVVWLLVEGGQIKLAEATATPTAAPVAGQFAGADASQQAAQQAAPAVDYGYGYGQQAQAGQAQAGQAQAGQAQAQPGQYSPTQYGQAAHAQQPGDSNATTAFVKPATDPGANPQAEQR